jgi:glycosyltransferase involved in cell wall biosynthesis
MTVKNVAFILYRYPLGVSSMIVNSIRLFARKGCAVDVYVNSEHYDQAPITFEEPDINVIRFDESRLSFFFRGYRYISRQVGDYFLPLARRLPREITVLLFFPGVYRFMKWLNNHLERTRYSLIIPVECMSLMCLMANPDKRNIIYYNLELLDWNRGDLVYGNNKRVLKELEFEMIRQISRVVTPSPLRSDVFSEINAFERKNVFNLPVAPLGEGVEKRSRFFRDMFRIPDTHRVVLYSGQFIPYFQCIEIIRSVARWPAGTVLVMHTWSRSRLKTRYFKEMKKAAEGAPVYFSTQYIEYGDLAGALSSADIGLAFYEALDDNYMEILFSSNKIGEYMKAGLGIVCSDFPSLKQFVEGHDIGKAVSVNDIPEAIKIVSEKIKTVRENVLRCYNENVRFENYFNAFYHQLEEANDS